MTSTDLPRPDVVGGRVAANGSSSHHEEDDSMVVAAIAVCTFLGFSVGLLIGLVL